MLVKSHPNIIRLIGYANLAFRLSRHITNWYDIFIQATGINLRPDFTLFFKSGEEFRLTHYKDSPVLWETLLQDIYQLRKLKRPKILIDIGAHIGSFSVMAGKLFPNSTIYSFEPAPDTYRCLLINSLANKTPNIKSFNIGISGKNGRRLLYNPGPAGQRTFYPLSPTLSAYNVHSWTLSRLFASFKLKSCDLLKIDCEGAEYEILFSTPPKLFNKIKRIVLEYHDRSFGNHVGLIEFFSNLGFHTSHLHNPLESDIGILYAEK